MRRLSRLLIVSGLVLLGWCAYQWIDASLAQYLARRSLEMATPSLPSSPAVATVAPELRIPTPPPLHGAPIAALSIPRVRLSAIVLNGTDTRTLRRGPGHLEDTSLPGDRGNVVIAGHRDSFFRPLRHVAVGDDVFLEGPTGRFHYRVVSLDVVGSRDLRVLANTNAETLTLITCFPFWTLGNAPDRFVVRAVRADQQAAPPGVEPVAAISQEIGMRVPASVDRVLDTSRSARRPRDDDGIVREALDRFRVAYNARLASRAETRLLGSLAFDGCDVSMSGDDASATCAASARAIAAGLASRWMFRLERSGSSWAVREIVSQ